MLRKYIMRKMGNKTLALNAALKYKNGTSIVSPQKEILSLNLIFIIITLPLSICLYLFYITFFILNILFLLLYYKLSKVDSSKFEIYYSRWNKIYSHWGKYPFSFLIKAVESVYYSRCDLNNSLEVGVYTGETSRAFFAGKRFSAGIEYNIDRLINYQKGKVLHDNLFTADIRNMPFKNHVFDNVVCVHSIDDMEFHAGEAILEVSRVLKHEGSFYFSGVTRNFLTHNYLIRFLHFIGLKKTAWFIFDNIYIGYNNFFNKEEWSEILQAHGLAIDSFYTFIPYNYSGFFYFAHHPESVLMNLFAWKIIIPFTGHKWFKSILFKSTMALMQIGNKPSSNEGVHFYIHSVKNNMESDQKYNAFSKNEICCPKCRSELKIQEANGERHYICISCEKKYSIVEGIPVFL